MSVLVEFAVDTAEFELGRVFAMLPPMTTIELESLVPLSGGTTPIVWIENDDHDELEAQIGGHPTVQSVERIERLSERSLYALEWTVEYDHLFRYIRDEDIHLLMVEGAPEEWRWTLRFRTHTSLSAFQDYVMRVELRSMCIRCITSQNSR